MGTNNAINASSPIQIQMGGTGINSASSYSVICAGTSATGAFQTVSGTGTAGQILKSNGPTALPSWSSISSPAIIQIANQVFVANGTYTPTAGMQYCVVQAIGGGGAGGGAAATSTSQESVGAGGGAGEYAFGNFTATNVGVSQQIIIGAGGTGNSGTTGNAGGNTSFGTLMSAFGGSGGTTGSAGTSSNVTGALGGTGGSGGNFRTPGQAGFWGVGSTVASVSGHGGNSQYGEGGIGQVNTNTAGANALGYGSGGGGALNSSSHAALIGGSGTSGIVIVTEYI